MKRLYFTVSSVVLCLSVNSQDILEKNSNLVQTGSLCTIPQTMTYDGSTGMYYIGSDGSVEETPSINILDKDFIVVKTYSPSATLHGEIVTKRRGFVSNYLDTGEFLGEGYWGDWDTVKEERYYCSLQSILDFYDEGNCRNLCLTQTLFNDDDLYEHIEIVYESYTKKEENDRDFDGIIDEEITTNLYNAVGFKIVQDDGIVLQTITGDEHPYPSSVYKINGKYYLCCLCCANDNYYDQIYSINKNVESGIVQKVGLPMKISISPTIVSCNESICITLDGESPVDSRVTVNDVSGRAVYSTMIPAGQKSVTVDASRLSRGLNVVSVSGGNGKSVNYKVLVK